MGFRTKQIHAGVRPDPTTGAILTPIYQSTTFVQDSVDEYMAKGYSYTRGGNPTVRALEEKLTVLEGGHDCTAYSSGMAATVAVFLGLLQAGDHVIIADVVYGGTYRFADQFLTKFGVDVTFADASEPAAIEGVMRPETRLVFTESPANPTLQVTDLALRTGGGACFSRHLSVERNFRDARAAAVMAPTTDVLHDFIGKTLLDMPLL